MVPVLRGLVERELIAKLQLVTVSMIELNLLIDLSPFKWNFDLNKSGQKFHHSLKEHHKISNIPKFRCKML
jgi:hypothetical protein